MTERDLYFLNVIVMRFGLQHYRKGIYRCDCVICGDSKTKRSKRRMYFIAKTGVHVYCHNCGYSSSLRSFIEHKAPDLLQEYLFYGFTDKLKSPAVNADELKEKLQESITEIKPTKTSNIQRLNELTKCFSELKEDHHARKYVERRLIPFSKVRFCSSLYKLTCEFDVGEQYSGFDIPCMIIPFFLANEKLEIFQARFFDKKVKPKYITVKLNPGARKIYNADFVDYSKPVYILEGPIDSMSVPNAIALAGSDGTPEKDGDYIWVFDNERKNREIASKIESKIISGEKVILWKSTDYFKDINDGIVAKDIDPSTIDKFLRERTFSGLKAKLEFVKWKSKK